MKYLLLLIALSISNPIFSLERISKVNFLQEGEVSRLVIDLTGEAIAEKFHMVDNKQILLDLKGVTADPKILRAIDTSEFTGSIVYISPFKKQDAADEVRFVIQLRDNVQSQLTNSGTQIVLDVENRFGVFAEAGGGDNLNPENFSDDSSGLNTPRSGSIEDILENLTLAGNKKYVGKRITINVKDLGVDDILRMIADVSGFNIITDKEVSSLPKMSMSMTNTPWDEALDTILKLNGLVATRHANILNVKTESRFVKEKEAEIAANEKYKTKTPLVTKVFPISFAKLDDVIKTMRDYITPDRGKISSDNRTQNIIVKDTPEVIEKLKKIVVLLDKETPQVLIEAKIVEAVEEFARQFGFTSGIGGTYQLSGPPPSSTNDIDFNFNSAGANGGLFGVVVNSFKRLTGLEATLQLQEQERNVKIVSSPRIVTQNKETAKISTSDEVSYKVVTNSNGVSTESFQTTSADLTLNVTPQVANDGSITLKIDITKGSFKFLPTDGSPPPKTSNAISTNILVDNGSTVVIGGLYETTESETVAGVPLLKDIPIIGWLFRTASNPARNRRELLVFLTPRILNNPEDAKL